LRETIIMRVLTGFAMAVMAATLPVLPVAAAEKQQAYEYDGKRYETRAQCLAAKKRSEKRATIVGAATAGIGAALLGGNVGETALVAGGGAVVGNVVAGKLKKC
jgi:hypothetical protein